MGEKSLGESGRLRLPHSAPRIELETQARISPETGDANIELSKRKFGVGELTRQDSACEKCREDPDTAGGSHDRRL
jgi:hypothetical protein